jgi:hypothetical protein
MMEGEEETEVFEESVKENQVVRVVDWSTNQMRLSCVIM